MRVCLRSMFLVYIYDVCVHVCGVYEGMCVCVYLPVRCVYMMYVCMCVVCMRVCEHEHVFQFLHVMRDGFRKGGSPTAVAIAVLFDCSHPSRTKYHARSETSISPLTEPCL